LTRVFTNAVTNAQLQILFTPVVDNARVSGVQVRKLADVISDSDGIPDWWRLAYFGHALGQAGDLSRAGDDADGDGVSNGNEFLAGTDPLNPASVFRISNVSIVNGSNVLIACPTVTNRSYQLQKTASLGAWSAVGPFVPGTNGLNTWTDSGPTTNPQFYRVQVQ
jgi:hypothetical protein